MDSKDSLFHLATRAVQKGVRLEEVYHSINRMTDKEAWAAWVHDGGGRNVAEDSNH